MTLSLLLAVAILASHFLAAAEICLPAPPASLAKWYKPENSRQQWLHTMFALRRELQALEHYVSLGDQVLLQRWSERFAANYRSIATMVPEWRDALDEPKLVELEQAVAAGDYPNVARIARSLQASCRSCHSDYRAVTAMRYRSPDFSTIDLPLPEGDAGDNKSPAMSDYQRIMESLSHYLNGVKISAEDGFWPLAEASLSALKGQLTVLEGSCATCHREGQQLDALLSGTAGDLAALTQAVADRQGKETAKTLGGFSVTLCARCHAAHRLAADMRDELQRHSP
ncbi:MAG: hypothetical protein HQL49_09205 [Gammaproteobacteria bacterium]|nr:hypothetical protein [Gammaproteobacteria bacterium]